MGIDFDAATGGHEPGYWEGDTGTAVIGVRGTQVQACQPHLNGNLRRQRFSGGGRSDYWLLDNHH